MLDSTGVSFGFPFVRLCQFVQKNHWRPNFSGFVSPDSVVFHTMKVLYPWVDQAAWEVKRLSCRMTRNVILEDRTESEGSQANPASKAASSSDRSSPSSLIAGRDEPFATLGVPCTLPSLKDRAIKRICRNYQIWDFVILCLPEPDEWTCSSSGDEVCFYKGALQAGLRFPMPPFIREFLEYLNISLTQLSPNAWRMIIGMMVV